MKKELLKGFTMVTLIVVFALAGAVVSANAQSPNRVVANIPFEFVVGGDTMPAGDYVVTAPAQDKALRIQSSDTKSATLRLANSIESRKYQTNARLVFHRYGERYFLAEVWCGADSTGRQLVESRQERSTRRELASISAQSAKAGNPYETIEVVGQITAKSH
jgi:hypothetical protein